MAPRCLATTRLLGWRGWVAWLCRGRRWKAVQGGGQEGGAGGRQEGGAGERQEGGAGPVSRELLKLSRLETSLTEVSAALVSL